MADHPYMDEGLRRWIISYARKNHWRVEKYFGVDDLIQEGYLCYTEVCFKYRGLSRNRNPTKNNRRVFMSLVKRTFINHVTDLANARTQKQEYRVTDCMRADSEEDHDDVLARIGGKEHGTPELIALTCMKAEMGKLFRAVHSDASEYVAYIKVQIGGHWRKETNAEYVARRAGFDLSKRKLGQSVNTYLCRRLDLNPNLFDVVGLLCEHYGVEATG